MQGIRLLLLLLFVSNISLAQNADRKFESFEELEDQLKIKVSDGHYLIRFYNNSIMETSFIPEGESFDPESHAVVLKPNEYKAELQADVNQISYSNDDLTVIIKKSPFQISYSYKGKKIISEKEGYSKNNTHEILRFNLDEEEVLYGGGARALGMNRRGNRLELYNKAHYGYEKTSKLLNYTMPITMSSKMYAVHFDNAPIGFLDLDSKKDNTLAYETISGRKTYQIIVGDSWLDLIDNYTDLTGKQPLPPKWAFGNFSSRFGYHSESETRATIDKFKKDEIPVDAVVLDVFWFGPEIKGSLGNFEFYRDSFPSPSQMIWDLKEKGVKTVLITEPFVLKTSNKWQEAVDKKLLGLDKKGDAFSYKFYFGNTGIIDIYKPEAKEWFWQVYQRLAEMGVEGIWGDLGEPEMHPSGVIHTTGTADEVHNIYGHDWARLVYEGYDKHFPEKRPFILMRAGYSGSQRFGLIPWSGDVSRSFGGLYSQTEIAMQMAMQGLAYMHSDLGGFAGPNPDDEVYYRWLQYGVFNPIFRPHAQEEVPSEPVFRKDEIKALAKKSIELRYSLLPYNYSLAFENNQNGAPLMRPVFFEEPTNIEALNLASTYLWGEHFLVTPVVTAGATEKEVYFPKGNNWFDFYTDKKHKGGKTKSVELQKDKIPTYIRGGAFIPMTDSIQNTTEYSLSSFDLHYYFDESVSSSSYQLYDDDGETRMAYEKGKYELLKFNSIFDSDKLTITIEPEIGDNYSSTTGNINLVVHNISKEPKSVNYNDFNWNKDNRTLSIPIDISDLTTKTIQIKLR